jgi:hypothetical protein
MGHTPLLVECGDRLGPQPLAAHRPHRAHGHAGINLPNDSLDQLAALVDLGDDAVRLEAAVGRDHALRPAKRARALARAVGEHIGAAVLGQAGDDDAARIGVRSARCRRIDGDDDAAERRVHPHAGALDQRPWPQRVGTIFEQLGVKLLPPEPRAAIAPDDRLEEARGEVGFIRRRRDAGHRGLRIGDERLDQPDRPRCRRHHLARARTQTQAELQRVPRVVGPAPFAELVAPRGGELRSPQRIGILGGEQLRDGAIVPSHLPLRWLVARALMWRMHRKQSRDAFDHHRAGVRQGLANKRDPQRRRILGKVRALHHCAHPFSPCPRLAGAAAA